MRTHVTGIRAGLAIGDEEYNVYRPLAAATGGYVEVAGEAEVARLPVATPDHVSRETFADWLLRKLQLPDVAVPSAPTRPESDPTPVTVRDWLNYCVLTDKDIDSAVFGHDDPFRNIKRRYVFQIAYGIYDIGAAALQERYRQLTAEHARLARSSDVLAQMLRDTPWENRAALYRELEEAQAEVNQRRHAEVDVAESAPDLNGSRAIRADVLEIETELASASRNLALEESAVSDLTRLRGQLETQSARLTRAIVAETRLLDFEFVVCPRCGSSVGAEREAPEVCRLCLQPPSRTDDRSHLVEEQSRIGNQISETNQLIERHAASAEGLRRRLADLVGRRTEVARLLDARTQTYVSDAATRIADRASERATAEERLRSLREYARLFQRMDAAATEQGQLYEELAAIEQELARLTVRDEVAEGRIRILERNFARILERFGIPRFADPPTAEIDRRTFLPRVDGRTFDTASQGMKVLINVAHALAHQLTAIEEDLPFPNLLMIDALSSNIGHGGYDEAVRERVYGYLAEVAEENRDRLQIVVADNDVPQFVTRYVRLALDRDDMLIPT